MQQVRYIFSIKQNWKNSDYYSRPHLLKGLRRIVDFQCYSVEEPVIFLYVIITCTVKHHML